MSDISVSWIPIARSAWRHRIRRGASTLTAGVATAVALVLTFDSQAIALTGGGVAMLLAAVAGSLTAEPDRRGSWCVGGDARVLVRWTGDADAASEADAAFVSSFLIVLRQRRRTLEVWRDATPAPAFRRLAVAVRWRVAREFSVASGDRLHAADRT